MKKITIILTILAIVLSGCCLKQTDFIDYVVATGEDPDIINKVKNVDLLVIDAEYFTAEEIKEIKDNKVTEIYSYLNIGSVEDFRDCYEEFKEYTLGEYENWPNERWVDVSNSKWQEFIDSRIQELSEKGIDGFFVDNIDVYYLYPSDERYQGIVDILSKIKSYDKKVIINGGDYFVKAYVESDSNDIPIFDGVNQESVYTRYNFSNNECSRNYEDEINYYTDYLEPGGRGWGFIFQKNDPPTPSPWFLDRFGKDITIVPIDEKNSYTHVDVAISPQFFAWVMSLGEEVRITGPAAVVDEMKAFVEKILNRY